MTARSCHGFGVYRRDVEKMGLMQVGHGVLYSYERLKHTVLEKVAWADTEADG